MQKVGISSDGRKERPVQRTVQYRLMLWCFLPGKGRPSSPSWGKNDISSGHALGTNGQSFDLTCRWAKKKTSFADKKVPFCYKRTIVDPNIFTFQGGHPSMSGRPESSSAKTSSALRTSNHWRRGPSPYNDLSLPVFVTRQAAIRRKTQEASDEERAALASPRSSPKAGGRRDDTLRLRCQPGAVDNRDDGKLNLNSRQHERPWVSGQSH